MQVYLYGRTGVLSEVGQTLADCRGGFSDPRPGLDPGTCGLTVLRLNLLTNPVHVPLV